MANLYLVIVDGLGVGAQEDARLYGDEGTNTAGHVCAVTSCRLPTLQKLGFGNIIPIDTVPPSEKPLAAWGKMREVSAGKDSTTGHWEIAGIAMDCPFPTYPTGFPAEVVERFCRLAGVDRILANAPYSGTVVIDQFGEEHQNTGLPIVYTSADSVFQIACHTGTVPLEKLYRWCEIARNEVMVGEHATGRVIARPFAGEPGAYYRLTDQRHDYSLEPPYPNLPEYLQREGIRTFSIGKVIDLFAENGFSDFRRTKNNAEGLSQLLDVMQKVNDTFVFANLIDTDQLFGHRNDPVGYAGSLREFDAVLPSILAGLKPEDVLIITSDHGNDPTTPGTDHTREFVPLLVYPKQACADNQLGIRSSFRDVAASVSTFFDKPSVFAGTSFLK
jgi:phosphopentomutase